MPERIELSPRHLPEYSEGRTSKKNILSFLEEIGRAQIRKARNIFFGVAERSEGSGGGCHQSGIFDKVSLSEVVKTLQNPSFRQKTDFLAGWASFRPTIRRSKIGKSDSGANDRD